MVMGHGQFMWCSADYLNDDESKKEYQTLVQSVPDDVNKLSQSKSQINTQKKIAQKISLSSEQLNDLNTCARNNKVKISDLSPEQIADCFQISGFDAKDIKEYLVENAPKGQA